MKTLITICARGGSKGIPGKNSKLLAGKPLIVYTFESARQFKKEFDNVDIAFSTDSKELIDIALSLGFDVPYIRPDEFATDSAGKIETIHDILRFYEDLNHIRYDYILDLDVTSPLRNLIDLSNAFKELRANCQAYNLFSVSKANRNPYFNMVEVGDDGFYHLVKNISVGILSRQSAPIVFDMNSSFYFYKRMFFDLNIPTTTTDKSLVYEVPHICFDLDHPIDFEFLSYLIENNKIDFNWL